MQDSNSSQTIMRSCKWKWRISTVTIRNSKQSNRKQEFEFLTEIFVSKRELVINKVGGKSLTLLDILFSAWQEVFLYWVTKKSLQRDQTQKKTRINRTGRRIRIGLIKDKGRIVNNLSRRKTINRKVISRCKIVTIACKDPTQ